METKAFTARDQVPGGDGRTTRRPSDDIGEIGGAHHLLWSVATVLRAWVADLSHRALVWAWCFSLALHLVVLGVMIFVAFPEAPRGLDAEVTNVRALTSAELGPRYGSGVPPPTAQVPPRDPVSEPPRTPPDDWIPPPMPASAAALSGLGVGLRSGPGSAGMTDADGLPATGRSGGLPFIGLGGGGGVGGRGDLGAMGLSLGGGSGPQFFGVGGTAKDVEKIVYVVDRSGSMSDTFGYVRHELVRSITALRRTQRFHVIFFNSGVPLENPPKRLVSALEANRAEFFSFLETVTATGSTNPEKAMYLALSLNPDLVYFLSDGVFDAAFADKLAEWNKDRKVKICTIAYLDREGSAVLERIARESSGEFRYVSENELP